MSAAQTATGQMGRKKKISCNQLGGLGKAHQLFGEQLLKLLDELNEVLAA